MPACVAHHQFGQDVLCYLDDDLKLCAQAYKREFDIGLQGPDIFFYYKPYRKNEVVDYGVTRHVQPAIKMFAPILEKVRKDAALSYMIGLICHYTLDACCHPFIDRHGRDPIAHNRIEASYDRHIMLRRKTVESRYLLAHTHEMDFQAMASLWPGIEPRTLLWCAKSRRFYTWLIDRPVITTIVETVAGRPGLVSSLSLPGAAPPEQQKNVSMLDELYHRALVLCPDRICRAYSVMGRDTGELTGFELNYGGESVITS